MELGRASMPALDAKGRRRVIFLPNHPDFSDAQNAEAQRAASDAWALIEGGDPATAATLLEHANAGLPEHPRLALPYTRALILLERLEEAGPAALVSSRLCSLEPESYEYLATVLQAGEQKDLAKSFGEYAVNLRQNLAERPPVDATDSYTRGSRILEHRSKRSREFAASDPDVAPLLISTELWGAWHLEVFINFFLPALASENNLPWAGMHRPRSSLSVALPFEEYLFLRDDATFQELSEHVDICLHVIKHPPTWRPDYVKYKTMFILQNLSIREAIDEGAIYFPLPPDTVQADGTLPNVLRILEEQDKRAYFGFSPRVELETFAWMLGKFGAGNGVQEFVKNRRNLVYAAMASQHLVQRSTNVTSDMHTPWPSFMTWTIPHQGYAVCAFHLSPIAIRPDGLEDAGRLNSTIDYGYNPSQFADFSDLHVARDTDEYFGFSLSSRDDFSAVPIEPRWFSRERVLDWWRKYQTDLDHFLISHPIRAHSADISEELWEDAERDAEEIVAWLKEEI